MVQANPHPPSSADGTVKELRHVRLAAAALALAAMVPFAARASDPPPAPYIGIQLTGTLSLDHSGSLTDPVLSNVAFAGHSYEAMFIGTINYTFIPPVDPTDPTLLFDGPVNLSLQFSDAGNCAGLAGLLSLSCNANNIAASFQLSDFAGGPIPYSAIAPFATGLIPALLAAAPVSESFSPGYLDLVATVTNGDPILPEAGVSVQVGIGIGGGGLSLGSINDDTITLDVSVSLEVPEPSSLAMFGVGLFGLGLMHRRRRMAA